MFSHTVVFASQSAAEYVYLFFYVCIDVAVLLAWASILRKAGFSLWWMALPSSAAGLAIIILMMLFYDTRTVNFGNATVQVPATTQNVSGWLYLDVALYLASVVMFFVFAFVRWPVEREANHAHALWREERSRRITAQVQGIAGPMNGTTPPPVAQMADTAAPPARAEADAPLAPVATLTAPVPATFYCSWCGKQRSRDALAIHHCGSRERRPVFCSGCGRGLERDDEFCAACGTPATTLSPG